MPARLIQLLVLAVALIGTGAFVVAVSGIHPAVPQTSASATTEAIPVLPVVVVRPQREIPTLTAITVSPTRAERVAAGIEVAEASTPETAAIATQAAVLLPSGGFDMPYYSFGKTLHRMNKE